MNLDELQTARDRERQTDKLQQLRESFYQDAAEFIQQLRRERDRVAERADDPFDAPEVNQLTDEINTAETTVEALYEKRIGKLVKAASFDAAGLPCEVDGMTAEEQDLFDNLVGDIKQNRHRVMSILDGNESGSETKETKRQPTGQTTQKGTDDSVSAADIMGGETETPANQVSDASTEHTSEPPDVPEDVPEDVPPDASSEQPQQVRNDGDHAINADEPAALTGEKRAANTTATTAPPSEEQSPETGVAETRATDGGSVTKAFETNDTAPNSPEQPSSTECVDTESTASEQVERETVLITDDVETFVGFDDRDYDLACDDVVTLPAPNATVLIERDVAERVSR